MHKHVYSVVTYTLRKHQITIQVGKGGKRRNVFSTDNLGYAKTDSFKSNLRAESAEQVGKGGNRNKFSLVTQNPILSTHKNVHLMAAYELRVHQFKARVGKGSKRRNEFFTQHKINVVYAQTCSFKDNLLSESASGQNTGSG